MPPFLHFYICNATVHYLPPTLRCSMNLFCTLLLVKVNTRQPKHTLGTISSLDVLPRDLKKQLKHISILAYEGVMDNKIVFTQDELPSILPRSSWDKILNLKVISNSTNSSHTCTTGSPCHGSAAEGPVGRNQQQNNLISRFMLASYSLSVLLLTHSPIFFSALSGCVDDQISLKSTGLYVCRIFSGICSCCRELKWTFYIAAASDNAPSSDNCSLSTDK